MVALSQLVLLITTKVTGTKNLAGLQSGMLGVGGAATLAAGAMAALTAAAIAFAGMSLQKYFEFSIQMGLVAGATRATEEEFELLEAEAIRLGRTLGTFDATEAATAMKLLAFSGFEVNEILDATEQIMKLSIATQTDLALATEITAATLRTFKIEASDVSRVVDVLTDAFSSSATTVEELGTALSYVGPVAAASGVSLEETVAMLEVLANVGIKGSKAGTQLRQVLLRIQAPTSGAISVLKDLGIEMFELGPAAQATQRALIASTNELKDLENQMEKTAMATRELDTEMSKLNIAEAKNRLEVMKIRQKADREGRELTDAELRQIDALEEANDELAITQQELSIQRQELSMESEKQKYREEELNKSIEKQTELFNSQKGELKSVVNIMKEFEVALSGLSDAQKIEAINTIFGIRAISGFQSLLDNVDKLEEYTNALYDSAGAADEQAAIVEKTAGIAWKEFTSSISTFMVEVGKSLAPAIISMTDAVVEMGVVLDWVRILVDAQVQSFMLFGPLITALVWTVTEFKDELILTAKAISPLIIAIGILSTLTNPLTLLLVVIIGVVFAIGLIVRALKMAYDFIADKMSPIIELLKDEFIELKDNLLLLYNDIMGRLGPAFAFAKEIVMAVGDAVKQLLTPFINGLMLAIDILIYSLGNLVSSLKELGSEIYDDIGPGLIVLGNFITFLGEKLYEYLAPALQLIGRFVMENTEIFLILLAVALWPLVVVLAVIVAGISIFIAALIGAIAVITLFVSAITYLIDGITWLNEKGDEFRSFLIEWIADLLGYGDSINTVTDAIDLLVSSMTTAIDTASNLVDTLSSGDFSGAVSTITSAIPGAAKGDLVTMPSLRQVAEDEPELITPLSQLGGTSLREQAVERISTNDTYNINLNVPEGANGFEILEMIRDAIEDERTNKRGSVFNSG